MPERRAIWASSVAPSVISRYLYDIQQSPLWTEWNMRHITTHRAGSTALKVMVFGRAVLTLAVTLIRARPDVVHLHASDKPGSLLRSRTLAWMCGAFGVPVISEVHALDTAVDVDWRRLDALYREASQR